MSANQPKGKSYTVSTTHTLPERLRHVRDHARGISHPMRHTISQAADAIDRLTAERTELRNALLGLHEVAQELDLTHPIGRFDPECPRCIASALLGGRYPC